MAHDGRALDSGVAARLVNSHLRIVGRPLVDAAAGERRDTAWLYRDAPFCLLAHDDAADPCLTYGNKTAQACFGYGWDELVGLPSRLTAEPAIREKRQRLLDAVARDGFIADYAGVRIAKSGRRFWIEAVTVWNVVDAMGRKHGQAAMFRTWRNV